MPTWPESRTFGPDLHHNHTPPVADRFGGGRTQSRTVWARTSHVVAALVLVVCAAATASAQVRVGVAWDPNADGLTAGYRVMVGTIPGVYVAQSDVGMQTSLALDLPLGQVYYVAVCAYTVTGLLGPSSGEVAIDLADPPAAPTDFRASVNGSQATLAWGPPPGASLPTQYLLTVGRAPGAADVVSRYPLGLVSSVSGGLPQGHYYARIQASNILGPGQYSPEISFQINSSYGPASPVGLSATWQGTVAILSWSAPPGAVGGDAPSTYLLEAGRASGSSDVAAFNVGNLTSYATDVPLGTYYVRVRGVNALGVSGPSNEIVVQGRGGPGRPTGLSSSGSGSVVTLRWNAPGTGAPPTGYVIEAGSAPGLSDLIVVPVGNQTTVATTAPPGTYYVRVRAANARGTGDPSTEIVVRR